MPPVSSPTDTRPFRNGILIWLALSVFIVLVRGIRWDENYEFAQVMLGHIRYPEWHPLRHYTQSFYSLQPWSLAAVMSLAPGPLLANGLRNVMMLSATVLPAFTLAFAVSRKVFVAHTAVLLTLAGIHTQFFSNYPVQIWPDIYSNGHVGQGWALMTLALWALSYQRVGWVMFGLMPGIHLGQFPALALCGSMILLYLFHRGKYAALRTALTWMLPGLLISTIFYACVSFGDTVSTEIQTPPDIDAATILQSYLNHFASHRALPVWTGFIPLGLLCWLLVSLRRHRLVSSVFVGYALALVTLACGSALLHRTLGGETPAILLQWMPYRILNHAAPILIAMGAGLIASRTGGGWFLLFLLATLISRILCAPFLPETFYNRYLGGGELWFFLLVGGAKGAVVTSRSSALSILLIPAVTLALMGHQLGAAGILAGGLATCAAARLPARVSNQHHALGFSVCVLLLMVAGAQLNNRTHLPTSSFDREAAAILAEHNPVDSPVLVPWQQESMQARLHQPTMVDMATVTWVPYKPSLGPTLWMMYRELYGIEIAPGLASPVPPRAWHEVWRNRSQQEWKRLSENYEFSYVIAPGGMELPLDKVHESLDATLYRVVRDLSP